MPHDSQDRAVMAELVLAGGLTAIGFVTGQGPLLTLATTAAGVGGNWVASLAERGFHHWRDKWFTERGALNEDITWALGRAFQDAVQQLERDWKSHGYYQRLKRTDPEAADRTLAPFSWLREDAGDLLMQPNRSASIVQRDEVTALLQQNEAEARRFLNDALQDHLYGHDEALVSFVEARLADEWLLRFNDVLRGAGEKETRAWRAIQQLWQRSLEAAVGQMQRDTAETRAAVDWLQDWARRLESLPALQRNSIGRDALDDALAPVRSRLDEIKADTESIKADLEELLETEADRLSESMLREIAYNSLSSHRRVFAIGHSSQRKEIPRDAHQEVMRVLETSAVPVVGLRGASGTGKSTLLRQVGRDINARGGIALWVPAEELVLGTSISSVLLSVLRRFRPPLNLHAGDDAVRLVSLIPGGLVLLVDDVNRLTEPHMALRAIRAWQGPSLDEGSASSERVHSGIRFVVPLWPGQLTAGLELGARENDDWQFVELHPFSSRERAKLADISSDSYREEARQIIEALDGDPFLCGLASTELTLPVGARRSVLVRAIFENALRNAATEAASQSQVQATPNEFVAAVDGLVELMLQNEEPEPQWKQVRDALDDRKSNLLYLVGETNQLGWIDYRDTEETWRWKHDRLRDALVGRWLANNVLSQIAGGSETDESRTWLSDPGLAEAWALALVFLPSAREQAAVLRLLIEHAPLALAEALRLNLFPDENDLRELIAAGLREALVDFDESVREFVGSPQHWILEKFSQTNDDLVLEITEGLNGAWYLWAARFRNGDLSTGLEWMRREALRGDFLPDMQYPLLEQSIEAFSSFYDVEREFVASELAQAVEQPDLSGAAITLAGYLAWPELSRAVWDVWNSLSDKEKLETLVPIVWTLSRCGDKSVQPELETALLFVRELSDEARDERVEQLGTERLRKFMEPLRLALHWPISSSSAETWAKVADEHDDLRKTLCYLLRFIDHPATIETYVRWSAEQGGTFWDDAGIPVDPLTERAYGPTVPTSQTARDRLWEIIREDPDETTRKIAFRFWKRSTTAVDLERLRSIPSSDPLFDEMFKLRLTLRDRTAVSLLTERIRSEPSLWCGYAPLFYYEADVAEAMMDNLEVALDDRLGRSDAIAEHLPAGAVSQLVRKKRDLFLRSPRTWLALWRSDVSEALGLVREAVSRAAPDDLQFFFFRGGFPFPVSQRMLDVLTPVLNCFPVKEQERLADLAVRNGFVEWAQEHLLRAIKESGRFWLTEEKTVDILKAAAETVPEGVQAVLKNTRLYSLEISFRERHNIVVDDIIGILKAWLGHSPDANELTVAAMLVARFGTSSDISWWQSMEPEGEPAYTTWSNALYVLRRRRWHS